MIRFIDLRDQIMDVEDYPVNFAFYDTVTSRFIEFNGSQDWSSRDDFLDDFEPSPSRPLERFTGKMPEWVK